MDSTFHGELIGLKDLLYYLTIIFRPTDSLPSRLWPLSFPSLFFVDSVHPLRRLASTYLPLT